MCYRAGDWGGWRVARPKRIQENQVEGCWKSQRRERDGNREEWWIEKLFREENRQRMEVYLAQDREVPRMTPSSWLAPGCLLSE